MTLQSCLTTAARRLEAAGVEAPMREARLFARETLGVDFVALAGLRDHPLSAEQQATFDGYIARRVAREPASRILGRREFWSLPFVVAPAVLDPRPDSETLIETVLRHRADRNGALRILDLGTGSGCLLLTLLHLYQRSWGLGLDRCAAALRVADKNAHALGVATRVAFCQGDWADAVKPAWDLILCNPPYIPRGEIAGLAPEVRGFDPTAALDGGADGLAAYRHLAPSIAELLMPDGLFCVELGFGQETAVRGLLQANRLAIVDAANDLSGVARCLVARHC